MYFNSGYRSTWLRLHLFVLLISCFDGFFVCCFCFFSTHTPFPKQSVSALKARWYASTVCRLVERTWFCNQLTEKESNSWVWVDEMVHRHTLLVFFFNHLFVYIKKIMFFHKKFQVEWNLPFVVSLDYSISPPKKKTRRKKWIKTPFRSIHFVLSLLRPKRNGFFFVLFCWYCYQCNSSIQNIYHLQRL